MSEAGAAGQSNDLLTAQFGSSMFCRTLALLFHKLRLFIGFMLDHVQVITSKS